MTKVPDHSIPELQAAITKQGRKLNVERKDLVAVHEAANLPAQAAHHLESWQKLVDD